MQAKRTKRRATRWVAALNIAYPLNHQSARAAAAIADTGYADTAIALLQYGRQGNDDASRRSAQWVAHRYGATVNAHDTRRQPPFAVISNSDHRKGFIDLIEVYLVRSDSGVLQRARYGLGGGRGKPLGGLLCIGVAPYARQRLQPQCPQFRRTNQHQCGRSVVER